jgi:hypothetical protein
VGDRPLAREKARNSSKSWATVTGRTSLGSSAGRRSRGASLDLSRSGATMRNGPAATSRVAAAHGGYPPGREKPWASVSI